jgi:hypothetical protein
MDEMGEKCIFAHCIEFQDVTFRSTSLLSDKFLVLEFFFFWLRGRFSCVSLPPELWLMMPGQSGPCGVIEITLL